MQLAGDDIGIARRFQQAERNSLGENKNQQRAVLVRDFGRLPDVFHDSEEIRRLDDHGRGFAVDLAFKIGECRAFLRRAR